MLIRIIYTLAICFVCCFNRPLIAGPPDFELIAEDNFEQGADDWAPTNENAWKIKETKDGHVYSLFDKQSEYSPPHRSPDHISLRKEIVVSDFVLDVHVLSTHPDYVHRDMCLFFGYQNPARYYYVHLGKLTDEHANQIFIVNDAPRTKISTRTTPGTDWDDHWHHVRIVRQVDDGTIRVYFDDMDEPIMEAQDETFSWGQVGLGSFDDTGDWDNFELRGVMAKRPNE